MGTVLRLFCQGRNIKGEKGKIRENPLNQGGLSDLTRPRQHHNGKLMKEGLYCFFVFSLNPHADILQYKCKKVKISPFLFYFLAFCSCPINLLDCVQKLKNSIYILYYQTVT